MHEPSLICSISLSRNARNCPAMERNLTMPRRMPSMKRKKTPKTNWGRKRNHCLKNMLLMSSKNAVLNNNSMMMLPWWCVNVKRRQRMRNVRKLTMPFKTGQTNTIRMSETLAVSIMMRCLPNMARLRNASKQSLMIMTKSGVRHRKPGTRKWSKR